MNNKQKTILTVDDEIETCNNLVKYLNTIGYKTDAVHNGKEAVEYVKQRSPHVVIMDIKMPVMNGIEALKQIRLFNDDCAVIMLTAVDGIEYAITSTKEGADDFIRKPVVLIELKMAIEAVLEKKRLIYENRQYQRELEKKVYEKTKKLQDINIYLKNTTKEIVQSLAEAIEAKDPYTKGHCARVTMLSLRIGKEIGLTEDQLEALEYGAILHDIGKIGVRGEVLNKNGKLTIEEYDHVKTHSEMGSKIIGGVHFLSDAVKIVRQHHERIDGKGYPDHLKGLQIDIKAQIATIADVYDALTSSRPYRDAISDKMAIKIILEGKGAQFNPELLDLFIDKKLYLTLDDSK